MFLVVTGFAQESRIAAGPGVTQVVCSGSSPERLRSHLAEVDGDGVRAVISFGIAGGLDPSLASGDVVLATSVIAESESWEVPTSLLATLKDRLHANGIDAVLGHLVGVEEPVFAPSTKAALRRTSKAVAVDMESHIGAAFAARNGLPFAAIRVISDPAHRALPPMAKYALTPDGRVDMSAVLSGLARAPLQIGTLIQAGADTGRALAGLRRCRPLLDFGLGFSFADF